jgi:Protein of unknown function (DUF1064)
MSGRHAASWSRYLEKSGIIVPGRSSKYGAVPTTVDGIRFDSAKEARRYGELRLLEKTGAIRDLEIQPKFPIDVVQLWDDGHWTWRQGERLPLVQCGVYTADFRYRDAATDLLIIEDVKSGPTKTAAYRLRKRLIEAIHGVKISEV